MDWNITIPIHGLEYWGSANETDVEIDGLISKALIDSGVMSKGYCVSMGIRYNLWIIWF